MSLGLSGFHRAPNEKAGDLVPLLSGTDLGPNVVGREYAAGPGPVFELNLVSISL